MHNKQEPHERSLSDSPRDYGCESQVRQYLPYFQKPGSHIPEIQRNAKEKGLYLRPRFSPGYGDFALEYQKDIFRMLECEKRIGITLTEGNLMMPSKSNSFPNRSLKLMTVLLPAEIHNLFSHKDCSFSYDRIPALCIDPVTAQIIEETAEELEQGSSPKSIYREYDCQVSGNTVYIGHWHNPCNNRNLNVFL